MAHFNFQFPNGVPLYQGSRRSTRHIHSVCRVNDPQQTVVKCTLTRIIQFIRVVATFRVSFFRSSIGRPNEHETVDVNYPGLVLGYGMGHRFTSRLLLTIECYRIQWGNLDHHVDGT